jgi:hypothetical protein
MNSNRLIENMVSPALIKAARRIHFTQRRDIVGFSVLDFGGSLGGFIFELKDNR